MELTLVSQTNLTPKSSDQPAFLARLQSQESLNYQPGDWVTLQPANQPGLVAQVISKLNLDPDKQIELRRAGKVSVVAALTYHLELTLLNPAVLNKLSREFGWQNWPDRAAMIEYAATRDVLDLINEFPQIIDFKLDFLQILAPLAPRYYSIASVMNSANTLDVVYKAIQIESEDRLRSGVATGYLQNLAAGSKLNAEIKPNPQFKLPADPAVPIIMLGAGTGIAPFIGFLQARIEQSAKQNWLFFGETKQASRFLFEQQLTSWQQQGFLRLDTAFSRDQTDKVYVQHLLAKHSQAWLRAYETGAVTYVCGDRIGMGAGVEQTLKQIWQEAYGWSEQQLQQAWQDARKSGQIQLDIY